MLNESEWENTKLSNIWTRWIQVVDNHWDGSKALRIIYMFKQYNMWRREKTEEILLRRKIRSIYIKKWIENIIKQQKVY